MNNFKKGGFKKGGKDFGGRPKFGGNKFGGGRPGGKFGGDKNRSTESFPATCSECHNDCEVPFRPSNDKPVYCSNCFGKKKNEHGHNEPSQFVRPQNQSRPDRSERSAVRPEAGLEDVKRQLSVIEARLNRILDLINPPMPAVKAPEVVTKHVEKKASKPAAAPKKAEVAKKAPAKVARKVVKKAAPKPVAKKVVAKVAKKVAKKVPAKVANKAAKKTAKKSAK